MTRKILRHVPWFGLFLAAVTLGFETETHFDEALFYTLQSHLALDWESLEYLEVYRVVVSPFLQTSPGFSPTIFGLTTIVVPLFELRARTWRTIVTFFAGDWLSTLPILFLLKAAGTLGNETAARLASEPDSGSSSGGFACMGALALALPSRLRIPALAGLAGFFAIRIAFWHRMFDFQHGLATLVGMAVWLAWERRLRRVRKQTAAA